MNDRCHYRMSNHKVLSTPLRTVLVPTTLLCSRNRVHGGGLKGFVVVAFEHFIALRAILLLGIVVGDQGSQRLIYR